MPRIPQEWSLGDPTRCRLFRWWGTPVVDLCSSRQEHRVLQYFSLDLSDRRASGGDVLKERWPKELRYAFPPPKMGGPGFQILCT